MATGSCIIILYRYTTHLFNREKRRYILSDFGYIEKNLKKIEDTISHLASKMGTAPARLIPVTKSGSDEELLALCALGVTDIAENRPGELKRRGELIRQNGFNVRLHEIGNLQTNKVKMILDDMYLLHSLSSERLAREIERCAAKAGKRVDALIEINSAKEEQKGGFMPRDAEAFLETLKDYPHIRIVGMMTMGPADEVGDGIRKYFKLTKALFDKAKESGKFDTDSPILSMGMSDSYITAIEEGANLVRVGRAIFDKGDNINV